MVIGDGRFSLLCDGPAAPDTIRALRCVARGAEPSVVFGTHMERIGLDLPADTGQQLAAVARRHGLRLVAAFGSRVSGHTHPGSDLDLAVLAAWPDAGHSFDVAADLQAVFPEQTADVVWLNRADPLLGWQALRDAQLLWGDPRLFGERRRYAWRRFVEYSRFFALEASAVRRRLAELHDGR